MQQDNLLKSNWCQGYSRTNTVSYSRLGGVNGKRKGEIMHGNNNATYCSHNNI